MDKQTREIKSDQVKRLLKDSYSQLIRKEQLIGIFKSAFILTIWIISLILLESYFYLGREWKSAIILSALVVAVLIYLRERSNFRNTHYEDFYRSFSRTSGLPELKDALDLEKNNGNRELIDRAILQNLSRVESDTLQKRLKEYSTALPVSGQYLNYLQLSGLSLIVLLLCLFNFSNAASRSAEFWISHQMPNPFIFSVSPGDTTLEQGSAFSADILFKNNRIPDEVRLMIKTPAEDSFRERPMSQTDNIYQSATFDLNTDIEYYVDMDGFRSSLYRADVQLRPRFSDLQARITPPAYTELDTTHQTYPFSQVNAYQGSEILLSGLVNKPVRSIRLNGSNKDSLFTPGDSLWNFDYQVRSADTLRFRITDQSGLTNAIPFQIIINPLQDEYPVAEILEPSSNIEKIEPKSLNLLYRTSDDFGISSVKLIYELQRAYVDQPKTGTVTLQAPQPGSGSTYSWDLSALKLKPMDVLSYRIEVFDNDEYNGYKSASSRTLTLTVPSIVDYLEEVGNEEDEIQQGLEEVGENFEQISEQYEQFKEKLRENPESDYEQKRSLEQIREEQQQLEQKIDELNKQFEEIKKELGENNMISEETQQMYEELDKLMNEIDDPAFREALQELQEKLGQMNPDEMREALENAEFNEELYQERLERTIELFKQLKTNSDLEKMARSLDDLAAREKELFEEGNEEAIREQSQQTENELEKIEKQNEKIPEQAPDKSKESLEQLREELKEQLDKLQQEMQNRQEQSGQPSDQPEKRPESQEQQMQQMSQQIRQQMQNMQQNQMNINIAGLQYILYSLLEVSDQQENLVEMTQDTENRSQAYIELARDQRNMEGIFQNLSDSLTSLSQEIPQFANRINERKLEVERQLTRSVEQMAERQQRSSSIASRQALGGINEIAFEIANLLEQISNSGNGSGSGGSMEQMIEQLQQSGEQQQRLNEQLQDIINDIQGDRLTQDQMQRLNDLARQQNRIREQLEELRRSGALEEGDQLGSELERMIEEMEDTINDLRGGSADLRLVERQQNILSRMLNARDALQERDEEEEREGNTADPVNTTNPPQMTLEELEKEIRKRLNDPNFTKFSPDYQNLIRKYFELLKKLEEQRIN
ncbi:DUF4175 family protein [Balneola sp. MJW-20]|uniref:DUF4175 family protein n=1 Tax=Gracilimonas aurantiaca TaxID=3234185 RepID=UPI003465DC34